VVSEELPPGEYIIQVRGETTGDPDALLHLITIHAVHTADPTERIFAAARGAIGYVERTMPAALATHVLFLDSESGREMLRWDLGA
jgi:hypothetical protein